MEGLGQGSAAHRAIGRNHSNSSPGGAIIFASASGLCTVELHEKRWDVIISLFGGVLH